LRAAVPAEHGQLAGLLSEAFGDRWDAERVAAEFLPGNGVEATYVVVGTAGVAAAASARRLPDRYPEAGYVHYAGARVSERGRRLGEVVTRRVLVQAMPASGRLLKLPAPEVPPEDRGNAAGFGDLPAHYCEYRVGERHPAQFELPIPLGSG
jgi:hypothetical protein